MGSYEWSLHTKAGEVRNVSLLVASAVNRDGYREILGICEGAKEDECSWYSFLRHLVDRCLKGVQLVISDACRGGGLSRVLRIIFQTPAGKRSAPTIRSSES